MKEAYLAAAGRIRRERDQLREVVDRAVGIWDEGQQGKNDYFVDAVALNLHSFYAGLERLFEVIASRVDQTLPQGPNWHQELLEQMTIALPGVRPPVLSVELRHRLDPYRGFRHVVRNVYTMHLSAERVAPLVRDLPVIAGDIFEALAGFADTLEAIAHD